MTVKCDYILFIYLFIWYLESNSQSLAYATEVGIVLLSCIPGPYLLFLKYLLFFFLKTESYHVPQTGFEHVLLHLSLRHGGVTGTRHHVQL